MATLAQQAFRERNVELSVAAHAERAEEKHAGGAYIKSLVYGGRHHNDLRDRLRRGWNLSRKAGHGLREPRGGRDEHGVGRQPNKLISEMAERDFIRREWERETCGHEPARQGVGNARVLRSEGRFRRGRVSWRYSPSTRCSSSST